MQSMEFPNGYISDREFNARVDKRIGEILYPLLKSTAKAKPQKCGNYHQIQIYKCGECGADFFKVSLGYHYTTKFCPVCGREIDWGSINGIS